MLTLVIGGARSGKSRFAQTLACQARRPAYIATARAEDTEMAVRIARHREARPAHWVTIEEPLAVAGAIAAAARERDFVLLDCLTVWLSNFCWEHREESDGEIEAGALAEVARVTEAAAASDVVLVTNEVGCGLVPESPVGRLFRDLQGWVNQEAARAAERVVQVVAGIPVEIKTAGGRQ
jgi:adenosylcobinamide kinase/adenosylcobinamide-phosphate guanylyltransferase